MQIQKNLSVYHYFLPTHSECTWEIGSEHAGGGEWAHPRGESSMTLSGLDCEISLVRARWTFSFFKCNWPRKQSSHLLL